MAVVRRALRGPMVWFVGDPWEQGGAALHSEEDGVLLFEDGRVAARGSFGQVELGGAPVHRVTEGLIVPGFVDAHVHYPQLKVLGAYGRQLLDWLNDYTFPAERAFADPAVCEEAAELFVQSLLAHGVTGASVFCTVHAGSVDALFTAAARHRLAVLAGKVLMDRNAPDGLRDTPEQGDAESRALIARWHGVGRARYAVTPRFAPTSSPEQLERAGALLAEDPSLHMQTHLSENTAELAWVAELFPEARDYTDVYARFGLLGPRSIFAHGIHLSHREWGALRDSGSCIAHCPTSNLFLGSGLFDLTGAVQRHEVGVALASDVGGGTHLSPLRTMGAAYQVAQLRGDSVSAARLLWSHTAGAARALRLDDELGNLDVGQFGDAVVLRPEASALGRFRLRGVERPEERLFYALTTGDDRMVAETWVAGESAFVRDR